jgi:hypothetical protein
MAAPGAPKVSLITRIGAWFLVLCFSSVLLLIVLHLAKGKAIESIGWGRAVLLLLGALIIVPLVFYIAFTGRPPPWWKYLEYATDLERPLGQRLEDYKKDIKP